MEKYGEGLNYMTLLTQNKTPPSSGRSRISLNRKRSHRYVVNYNGNYEGDYSMFGDKGFELERLSLIDTESDTELLKETVSRSCLNIETLRKKTLAGRLIQFLMIKFVKPELLEKITTRTDSFMESPLYNTFSKWINKIKILFTFVVYLTTILSTYLAISCRFFWKRRVIFHNLVRRLLWRLTLAKCSDMSLFLLVLLSTPVLLILSLLGFIISICGCLKEALNHLKHIANKI